MNYEFPVINNISDVLPAIERCDEFTVAVKEGYTVINYNVMMADTFPDVRRPLPVDGLLDLDHYYCQLSAMRRECRGIIFDTASGNIIRRPFHKFFNVNEREETQAHAVNMSQSHAILEKLDGSMIAPFIVNGELVWGTKMGATDVAKPVEEFVKNNPQYVAFALECLERGVTPIFEWCSRKQRIVLDYREDQLILTAMRLINDGVYFVRSAMEQIAGNHGIPVVRQFEPQTDMREFVEHVRGLEDLEGFVVRFDDGHMVKLKCEWYLQIHKAKEAILQDRNIVELILDEKLDDIKAHLPAEDCARLSSFEHDFNRAVKDTFNSIINTLYGLSVTLMDRKTFALYHAPSYDNYVRPILFKNFDFAPTQENIERVKQDIYNTIRNNLTKTVRYEAIREAWFKGVVYNA